MIVCSKEQLKHLKNTMSFTEEYVNDLYAFTFGEHTITEILPSMEGEGDEACKAWVDSLEFPS